MRLSRLGWVLSSESLASLAGAYGGRITPSMMLGGMMAFASAVAWNALLPPISAGQNGGARFQAAYFQAAYGGYENSERLPALRLPMPKAA